MQYIYIRLLIIISLLLLTPISAVAFAPSPVVATHGMVVSEQRIASQVGLTILKQGGNAIDAAVAVGYALAVALPCCGNIGGGGFMLIHLANGKNIFLNFREKAPMAASRRMYLDAAGNLIPGKSMVGYLAVGVPGTVLGLDTALKKYGTMTRSQVMAPAIRLAQQGITLGTWNVGFLADETNALIQQKNVTATFFRDNKPVLWNIIVKQAQLANTLKNIAEKGPDYFYKGPIANEIAQASAKNGGIITTKDFANYNVEELSPIVCTYRGYTIISAPPPSSGGVTLCESLNILEAYPLKYLGFHSAKSIHYIVEAMRQAFKDRNNQLGDPNFVFNPTQHLLSKEYAVDVRKHIQEFRATPSDGSTTMPVGKESIQTTHISIVDRYGNAVAMTYTLNSLFGAKVMAGDTGFFLNNTMDDFSAEPGKPNQFGLVQGLPNIIAGGKRPLSAMAPTIVMKEGKVVLVLGSPGGPRIISSVLQTLLNVIDYDMNIAEAVDAPRFHHQWLPDVIDYEKYAISPDTKEKLALMGYQFYPRINWGAVEAIYIDPKTGMLYGANDDRRRAGLAVGY